jgi:hypothetical protein
MWSGMYPIRTGAMFVVPELLQRLRTGGAEPAWDDMTASEQFVGGRRALLRCSRRAAWAALLAWAQAVGRWLLAGVLDQQLHWCLRALSRSSAPTAPPPAPQVRAFAMLQQHQGAPAAFKMWASLAEEVLE